MTSTSHNNASQEACKIKCSKCHQEITIKVSNPGTADTLQPVIEIYGGDGVKTLDHAVGTVNTFCYNSICPNPKCGQEIRITITDDTRHHPEPEISGAAFIGTKPTVKELADLLIMLEESSK